VDWFVYVIRAGNGELYAGVTTDPVRRLGQHRDGSGAKYLRGRGPLALVYRCRIGARPLALSVEHGIKRLTKPAKLALVRSAPRRRRLLTLLGIAEPRVTSGAAGAPSRSPAPSRA
jgi:putative endonuclease